MAMAITTCGAPTGGIIYTLMFQQLINRLGFPWTIRAMAFFMLGTYLISFPLQLWGASNLGDLASGTPRKMFDSKALKDLPFWSYSFSNFFIFTGYMVPVRRALSMNRSVLAHLLTQHSPKSVHLHRSLWADRAGIESKRIPQHDHRRPSIVDRRPTHCRLHSIATRRHDSLGNSSHVQRHLLHCMDRGQKRSVFHCICLPVRSFLRAADPAASQASFR